MQVSGLLLTAAGLLRTTMAFHCAIGQYGECYYYQGSNTHLSRCAITCDFTLLGRSHCKCPKHYPNKSSWDYAHQNKCVYYRMYKCQNPDSQKRDGHGLATPEERDPADLEFQDHDLPLSVLDGLNSD